MVRAVYTSIALFLTGVSAALCSAAALGYERQRVPVTRVTGSLAVHTTYTHGQAGIIAASAGLAFLWLCLTSIPWLVLAHYWDATK